MLTSTLLSTITELRNIVDEEGSFGNKTCDEAIRRLQGALIALGYTLPEQGLNGTLNGETLAVIRKFKSDRGLLPIDENIDAKTLARIDYELSYQEGTVTPEMLNDLPLLKSDLLMGSILDRFKGRQGLEKLIIDALELGDKFCFRLSFVISGDAAAGFSKFIAEPKIFEDYRQVISPCPPQLLFFDTENSFVPYKNFLERNNPGSNAWLLIGKKTRPDILSHCPNAFEWYEVKPQSLSGIEDAIEKFVILELAYPRLSLPYKAGTKYPPIREIPLKSFEAAGGKEILDVYLEVIRPCRGLIFWNLCLKGDYVKYFNRVRTIAGVLAILLALAAEAAAAATAAAEAAEIGAIVAGIRALAVSLGVTLAVLRPKGKPTG